MTYEQHNKLSHKDFERFLMSKIDRLKNPKHDAQVVMFWHLQLQFLAEDDGHRLWNAYCALIPNWNDGLYSTNEELATELALHLSGLK